MRVALLHPGWDRACGDCERWCWKATGELVRTPGGDPVPRTNPDIPTPCMSCPKVPAHLKAAGKPWRELRAAAADMTPANRKAYAFYHRCKATGRFPDDPLVAWYAGAVRAVEDAAALDQAQAQTTYLRALVTLLTPRRR